MADENPARLRFDETDSQIHKQSAEKRVLGGNGVVHNQNEAIIGLHML